MHRHESESTNDASRDRIERRAYEIWEGKGRPHGEHDLHWQEAERQVRQQEDAQAREAQASIRERMVDIGRGNQQSGRH